VRQQIPEWRASLGEPPSALQPSRIETIFRALDTMGAATDVRTLHEVLKDLGPLTSSSRSKVRGVAKQATSALLDAVAETGVVLPATEAARQLMLAARAAFRREKALEDVHMLRRTAVTIGDDGLPRFHPERMLTRLDRMIEDDPLFAGSFTPQQLAQLRSEIEALTGLPRIPAYRPPQPGPVSVKDIGPAPGPVAPHAVPPAEPVLHPVSLPETLRKFFLGAGFGGILGGPAAQVGAGLAAADYGEYLLSRWLLDPKRRPLLTLLLAEPGVPADPGGGLEAGRNPRGDRDSRPPSGAERSARPVQ
jgi:hypothetical protein